MKTPQVEDRSNWRDSFDQFDEIGAGGVAKVYSARHRATGQMVAIKVMRKELQVVEEVRERFRREALAVGEIHSPHVCAVYDFDTVGDEAYMVMEFVNGTTLRDVLKKLPWTIEDISMVIGQISEGLYAAHQRGIIHRDLKPENVVVTGHGAARHVKVLDFGFAKLIEHERQAQVYQLTQAGSCFGTPQYMSPEQVRGGQIGAHSDLFGLGVMAYELVAARRPWNGKTPHATMLAVATEEMPPLDADARCGLFERRAELEAFFSRALAKESERRFSDAREFCRAFNAALGVRSNTISEDPRKWFEETTGATLFSHVQSSPSIVPTFGQDSQETLKSSWYAPPLLEDDDSQTLRQAPLGLADVMNEAESTDVRPTSPLPAQDDPADQRSTTPRTAQPPPPASADVDPLDERPTSPRRAQRAAAASEAKAEQMHARPKATSAGLGASTTTSPRAFAAPMRGPIPHESTEPVPPLPAAGHGAQGASSRGRDRQWLFVGIGVIVGVGLSVLIGLLIR